SLALAYGEQFLSRLPGLTGFLGGGLLWSLFGLRLRILIGVPVLAFLVIALSSYTRDGAAQILSERIPLSGTEDLVLLRPLSPLSVDGGYHRLLVSGWNLVP